MIRGFTCGTFDMLHPGHLHLLEWSSHFCDYLIVGLQTNPTINRPTSKNKPVQTTFERWSQLRAVQWVDDIIPYDTEHDLTNLLSTLDISVRFVGSEYQNTRLTAHTLCESRNITIQYVPRLHSWSSSELRHRLR